jgi:glucuronokinase
VLIIRKRAYARAGLLGNPSDGYHGKTISFIVPNFWAEVVLYEWSSVDIVLAENDRARFSSVHDLARDVQLHGYYGGIRLVKATIKRFVDYCDIVGISLHDRNFSVRYETNIPQQVGMAGSSAIIVATLRCLMEFYDVDIPLHVQPSLVLSVETEELGIAAGLQDRVIQCYEGIVYMDFSVERERTVAELKCYAYEPLTPALMPPFYVAYHAEFSEPTEIFHNDIRARFTRGDRQIVEAMQRFAGFAEAGRQALLDGDVDRLHQSLTTTTTCANPSTICRPGRPRWLRPHVRVGPAPSSPDRVAPSSASTRAKRCWKRLRQRLGAIGSHVIVPSFDVKSALMIRQGRYR